jgi:hypothetical protein
MRQASMAVTPRRRRAPHPVCANCGARLRGPWCHACGQHAEGLHRSVRQVLLEWAQGLVHFDQRARATLPELAFHPARLTNAYLEGRRAPQVPPLRMFLVVVLVVFATGSLGDALRKGRHAPPMFTYVGLSPATGLGKPGVPFADTSRAQKAELHAQIGTLDLGLKPVTRWTRERLDRVVEDPRAFTKSYEKWSRELAFLLLPISLGLLSLIFFRRREVMVFDHLVFAMHSLSFQGMLLAATELVAILPDAWSLAILLAGPPHLFVHLRGVYRTGVVGTLGRMVVLAMGSALAFLLLVLVGVLAGLAEMSGVP